MNMITIPPEGNEELFTYQQAARRLYISTRTLRRLVARGRVPHRRIGRLVRFTRADLDEILHLYRVAPQPRSPRRPGTPTPRRRP